MFQVRSKSQRGVRQKGGEEELATATCSILDSNTALLKLEPVGQTTKQIAAPIATWCNAPPALRGLLNHSISQRVVTQGGALVYTVKHLMLGNLQDV